MPLRFLAFQKGDAGRGRERLRLREREREKEEKERGEKREADILNK